MAQQAKCVRCGVRFEWHRRLVIRDLRCPHCRGPLAATSYQWKGRVEKREPDALPTDWTYSMALRSIGNHDLGQYAAVSNTEVAFGRSLAEMRGKAKAYIDFWSLGNGNWPEINIVDLEEKFVAKISYNGRLWDANGKEINVDE